MGYSSNPVTIRRLLDTLLPLLKRETQLVPADSLTPEKLAYKLREARFCLKKNPHEFPDLLAVIDSYDFRCETNAVKAIWIGNTKAAGVVAQVAAPTSTVLRSPSIEQIIQAYINQYPQVTPILCTDVLFTNEELSQLARWAGEQGWMVLHAVGQQQITVALEDPSVPDEAKVKP